MFGFWYYPRCICINGLRICKQEEKQRFTPMPTDYICGLDRISVFSNSTIHHSFETAWNSYSQYILLLAGFANIYIRIHYKIQTT
jgi:hypothetical protein